MPFEARRLRVQLPCAGSASLVEAPDRVMHYLPRTVYRSPVGVVVCPPLSIQKLCFQAGSDPCNFHTCEGPSIVPCPTWLSCGVLSPFKDRPWERIDIDPDPNDQDAVLLHPDDLPRFRQVLEKDLEQIEVISRRQGEIEDQLGELDAAEQALAKRTSEQ